MKKAWPWIVVIASVIATILFKSTAAFVICCIIGAIFLLIIYGHTPKSNGQRKEAEEKEDAICVKAQQEEGKKKEITQVVVRAKTENRAIYNPVFSKGKRPPAKELLYPAELPTFEETMNGDHADNRAIVYMIKSLNTEWKRFSENKLFNPSDFGTCRKAYMALIKSGLAESLTLEEEIAILFSREKMISLIHERGLSEKGSKKILAERLVNDGYKLDRRRYRDRFFRLTEKGKTAIVEHWQDQRNAVNQAICAIKNGDYMGAVSAYREFDRKWGFLHTSGKSHTIFAHYDFPIERFSFIEHYPMSEIYNSTGFKNTLRACIIVGLMRGCQEREVLRKDFEYVCSERIVCPHIVDLFNLDDNDETESFIKKTMQSNIEKDDGMTLEYYISHLLYLSRRS